MKNKSLFILFIMLCVNSLHAQEFQLKNQILGAPPLQGLLKQLFKGPSNSKNRDVWLLKMERWRTYEKQIISYNDAEYLNPQLSWLNETFIYIQMMAHDRYFYDRDNHKYTVGRFLDDLKKRYGGIDAVLIWPTYPNIGIDNRNQYDLVKDMPGGIEGVKQMIKDFHKRGVRVFFPIMIWDHGTRKIKLSMPVALIKEMKTLGADGLNGDTMLGVSKDFKDVSDSLNYPLILQPELGTLRDLKMIEWNTSSWGYWWNRPSSGSAFTSAKYPVRPGVSVYKWLEPRHQVFVTNRWLKDRTDDLQYAFFNGVGYNAWENIWGIWNSITKRNAEAIRRIATIYRRFPGIWNSAEWQPYVPTLHKGIFASKFLGLDETIYTIVNRDNADVDGRELQLPYKEGMKYFDIWNGMPLTPQREGGHIYLNFPIEGRGFGAVLAIKSYMLDNSYMQLLQIMHKLAKEPLNSYSTDWNPVSQQIISIKKTKPANKTPEKMVQVSAVKDYMFESKGTMIEGDPLPTAVGVQYPWESHPSRSQKHAMNISSFYIDKYPVTNRQFKQFLDATHYHPEDDHNFLKDWKNGSYPKGWGNKPVTWVSLKDARAYASWAGKRLPHEWEWQYAAQGTDGRLYPWGNKMDSTRIPQPDSSRSMRSPTDIDAYPQGASPFGVMDMVGNVWQWTDEYADEHTRSAVLKGGGYYRSDGSGWYFPKAYEVKKYGKYLLMAPSIDRSGTIGFRCVKDR